MIKKLKKKFILLSAGSLLLLLVVIIATMNFINYKAVVNEADEVLTILSNNNGTFPEFNNPPHDKNNNLPPQMSPEVPYESRYFSVLLDKNQTIIFCDTTKIATIDDAAAVNYSIKALNKNTNEGFIGDYRFKLSIENEKVRIIFLDCGRKLDAFENFLNISCIISLFGFLLIVLIICFFANRIIRPIAESYEKQKRFITDAGHEIKTPLTIINANIDILEMEYGPNESFTDIHQQTKRLTTLTNQLVYLAKMEEEIDNLPKHDIPLSEIVSESIDQFKKIAQAQEKELLIDIEENLFIKGNDIAIGQLITILLDNALKYSPRNTSINLSLKKHNKSIFLTVQNTTIDVIDKDNINKIFDRFYRLDESRNSNTGGHGIGLSIAKAIVEAHNAKITANIKEDKKFQIVVTIF